MDVRRAFSLSLPVSRLTMSKLGGKFKGTSTTTKKKSKPQSKRKEKKQEVEEVEMEEFQEEVLTCPSNPTKLFVQSGLDDIDDQKLNHVLCGNCCTRKFEHIPRLAWIKRRKRSASLRCSYSSVDCDRYCPNETGREYEPVLPKIPKENGLDVNPCKVCGVEHWKHLIEKPVETTENERKRKREEAEVEKTVGDSVQGEERQPDLPHQHYPLIEEEKEEKIEEPPAKRAETVASAEK